MAMVWIWLGLFILFLVLELEGNFLIFIWGAVGALAGLLVAFLGGHLYLQIFIAIITAVGVLVLLRKKSQQLFNLRNTEDMYLERLRNAKPIILEDVTQVSGQVKLDGKIWLARTDGEPIKVGDEAVFVGLVGNMVKLWSIVDPLEKEYERCGEECQKE